MDFLKEVLGIQPKSKNNISNIKLPDVEKIKDICEINLPIKELSDLVISTNNKYKIIGKVSPVNGELLSDEDLEAVAESINCALSAHDGRIGLYISSARVDIKNNLENIEKKKESTTNEFKSMVLTEQQNHLSTMTSKFRNVLNFYVTLESNANNYASADHILGDSFVNFKNELESSEMYCERLSELECKNLLYSRLNPQSSDNEPFQQFWGLNNILPQRAVKHSDGRHITIENELYRFFSITDFPQNVDKYRWLKKILKFKGNIYISFILNPKNKSNISKELSEAAKEISAKAMDEKLTLATRLEKQAEAQSAIDMINELSSDNVNFYDVNITIGISAPSIQQLDTLTSTLKATVSGSFCQLTELINKGFDPFFTTLPILHESKYHKNFCWNLSSTDVASIIPFDSSEYMENKGTLVGENFTSNGIVIADFFNPLLHNPHLAIIAVSGSGKSFYLMTDAIRHIPYSDYIFIFDLKGDLLFPFGQRYSFNPISGVITNPFHIHCAVLDSHDEYVKKKSSVGSFLITKIMDLIVFFKWIIKDMNELSEAILDEDIRDTYKTYCNLDFDSLVLPSTFPTFSDFAELISDKIKSSEFEDEIKLRKKILLAIKPYVSGAYSKMFNGQTTWNFDNFTVFDLSNLPKAVQKPLYDILLKDTWQFCKKDGTKDPTTKIVYADECHELADINNPQALEFLSTRLIKEGRGFGVRVVTATQNLHDLLSIPRHGQAVLDNSFFKLFMKLGETDAPVAQKLYKFSKGEMKVLETTNFKKGVKGKGIFIIGSQRVIIQTRASKFELEIIDPVQFEKVYRSKSRYFTNNIDDSAEISIDIPLDIHNLMLNFFGHNPSTLKIEYSEAIKSYLLNKKQSLLNDSLKSD